MSRPCRVLTQVIASDSLKYHSLRSCSRTALSPWSTKCAQRRARSSLNRLIFERDNEDTRPIVPPAMLALTPHQSPSNNCVCISIDGAKYELSSVYLRDTCQCVKCVDPVTTQKSFNTGDLEQNIAYTAIRVIGNALEVIWKDGHRSVFPAHLLSGHIAKSAAIKTRHNARIPILWDARAIDNEAIITDYKSYMTSESKVFDVVKDLANFGLAFLENCPAGADAERTLEPIVQRIGPLKNTFYGSTWNVKAVAEAKNVAYTSVDLDLHMDLLYYESPPGLQFLQCLQNEVEGGSSIFVDSFKVAEVMRTLYPAEFAVLCKYPVDFKYDNDGVYYHQSRPTFICDKQTGELEYVNYSPPFQGIQSAEGFAPFHKAISIFAELLADHEYRYETILKPGQCVIFNNRRTLHARRSFGPGNRWLKGAYADIDALWSKYRVGQAQTTS